MPGGLVVESAPQVSWAWFGLRLAPAQLLADSMAFPGLDEGQRRAQALAAERAYLSGVWAPVDGVRWELRYRGTGPGGPVECVLLGRVSAPDPARAVQVALGWRDRLGRLPRHVHAEPIESDDQVCRALAPPGTDPTARVELRKPLSWAPARPRERSTRSICVAISPLGGDGASWEPVWRALAGLAAPATVGVYLEPYQAGPGLTARLRMLADEYAWLATAASANPLWATRAAADPFAAAAAPGYRDALRRYAGRCFRIRISITSGGPIDPGFAPLLGGTAGGAVARPVAVADAAVAGRMLGSLERDWLDETYRQDTPPGALTDVERVLSDLVDEAEAAAAFRLPYEVAGHPPLFAGPGRPAPVPGPQPIPGPHPPGGDPDAPHFARP